MKTPPTDPVVVPLDGIHWRLHRELLVVTDDGKRWWVPRGFITDFASAKVGRFYLLTHRSTYSVPSIFHDYLYLTAKVSRKQADIYFHELLLRQGSTWYNRWKAYYGVRVFGWYPWLKYRNQAIRSA